MAVVAMVAVVAAWMAAMVDAVEVEAMAAMEEAAEKEAAAVVTWVSAASKLGDTEREAASVAVAAAA